MECCHLPSCLRHRAAGIVMQVMACTYMVRDESEWGPIQAPTQPARDQSSPGGEGAFFLLALPGVDSFCNLSAQRGAFFSSYKDTMCISSISRDSN